MRTLLATLLLLLAGCAERATEPSRESRNPAPSSSYTLDRAHRDAAMWVAGDYTRRASVAVAPTGSMLPVFGSNSVLLLERSDGKDLRVGDIALYIKESGDGTISHRVRAVSETAVIMTGDNNTGLQSDGWISKTRIRWRVAGILYAKR
jgi:signal peptidase I